METIYLICFIVGFVYAVFSVIFGNVFDFDFDMNGGSLPYFSPITIASFITVFGGTGMFLTHFIGLPYFFVLLFSIIAAVVISLLMMFLVVVPLLKAQKSAAFSDRDMIGRYGEVSTPILGSQRGEIIYEQGGSRLSSPALSVNKVDIGVGEVVEIVDVVSGTFVVKKLAELSELEQKSKT